MRPTDVQHPTFELTIGPVVEQVRTARHFVRHAVHDLEHGTTTAVDDAELLASEAVSNAVLHAGTEVKLRVCRAGDMIQVSVQDGDLSPIPPPRMAAAEDLGGRGLAIINALAASWGVEEIRDDGKLLWFLVAPEGVRGSTD